MIGQLLLTGATVYTTVRRPSGSSRHRECEKHEAQNYRVVMTFEMAVGPVRRYVLAFVHVRLGRRNKDCKYERRINMPAT